MKLFLILLNTSLLYFHAFGQHTSSLHEQYQFKALTIDDGLSNNRVRTMSQDQYGFLWMGTAKGISRYDGNAFKVYSDFFINDTHSEKFSELTVSLCDAYSNIWFGGAKGLFKYNLLKDHFEEIHLTDDNRVRNCTGIAQDTDSTLWVIFQDRIIHYDEIKNTKKTYQYDPIDKIYSPPLQNMARVVIDHKGNLWITSLGGGLVLFNKKTQTFTLYTASGKPEDLAENVVENVFEDPEGTIWVSYHDLGLSRYDPMTNTFHTLIPDPNVLQSGRVRGLLVDHNGIFWVGTRNGIYLFDKAKETFQHYASMDHPKSRLSHNSIYFFFLDKQQNFWVGTHAGGVCYTNLNASGFTRYDYSPIPNEYFLNDKAVYTVEVDDKNNIWIGTSGGGVNYIDRKTGKFKYYINDVNDASSIPGNDVKAIAIKNNTVWIGMYGTSLACLDINTNKFSRYTANRDDSTKLHSPHVSALAFDPRDENLLWVGTEGGLSLLNIKTKKFTRMGPGALAGFTIPRELGTQKTSKIIVLDKDRIAFASRGIYILNYLDKTITVVNKVKFMEIGTVLFAHADRKGALWFASDHNILYRMDLRTKVFNVFTTKQGLPDVEMYGALDDAEGNLWVSSNNGLYRFQNLVNKFGSLVVDRFDGDDNLQSIEFNLASYAEGHNNELFFGGVNGLNSFNPANIKKNPYKPFVHITNLTIENKSVAIGDKISGDVILTNSVLNTDELKIQYNTKSFVFTFNAVHYSAPENNQLAYKLEGYDEDWTYLTGSEGRATYTSIPSGTYTFRVKAANNNGVWNEEGDFINITVPTPFYKTIWFYVLMVILLGVVVYWIIKVRERKLNEDKKALEFAIDEKTSEVEVVKQEILRKDEANKIKNWLNSSLKEFVATANKNKDDIQMLNKATLKFFKKTINTPIGTILVLNDTNPDDIYLENVLATTQNGIIRPREGLAGSCFSRAERMLINNIPNDYVKISSGLGAATPKSLLLVPIKIEEKVLGVIELCSFAEFPAHYIDLVENVVESLASSIFIMKTNELTQLLLARMREQTEELRAQEEEMRQNMEELEATAESYKRRENELEARVQNFQKENDV